MGFLTVAEQPPGRSCASRRSSATMTFRSAFVLVGLDVVAGLLGAREVRAACNVIPQAARSFRGAVGKTNRPFAGPDEFVQVLVQPSGCDQESPGFTSFDADDYVVTIVFKPTDSGPKNVSSFFRNAPASAVWPSPDASSCASAI